MFYSSIFAVNSFSNKNDTISWTLENGYLNGPLDADNYPFNTLGGLFGRSFSFVLNVLKFDLTNDCSDFGGFKVKISIDITHVIYDYI